MKRPPLRRLLRTTGRTPPGAWCRPSGAVAGPPDLLAKTQTRARVRARSDRMQPPIRPIFASP